MGFGRLCTEGEMGFRFRKSFKVVPGVRLNLSKSGLSTSLGGKGVTLNLSKKGHRTTVDLPGSGMSIVSQSKGQRKRRQRSAASSAPDSAPSATFATLVSLLITGLIWYVLRDFRWWVYVLIFFGIGAALQIAFERLGSWVVEKPD